ncbi:MAG TPA: helix-turn-helix domain-containing protein, partial [Ktedonobacteraceae bacterium]|nr:helix-turn-helix domain-containing protein [Ktedonobacteraceae bacterium]
MKKQLPPQDPEQIPPMLFIYLNQYGQLEVKTRLVLTIAEVAEVLTLGAQKVRWMVLRGELPSFHFGTRRVVSLEALEHYIRECEIEEQQERLSFLERYYGHFGFGKPHPEIQRAQERLNGMQQGQHKPLPEEQAAPISIEAALYHITITEAGRLECTPRWLLSLPEVAQLLGISRSTIWVLSKQDDFPIFHINRRACIRVESLLNWIRTKEHPELE